MAVTLKFGPTDAGKLQGGPPLTRYWYHIRFSDEEVRRHRVEVFLHRFERFYQTLGQPAGMVLYRAPGMHNYYFSCGPFEYAGRIYREFPAQRLDHPPEGKLELVFGEQCR